METKNELNDLLRQYMMPDDLPVPTLNEKARLLVKKRKQNLADKNDLIVQIAWFLNRKLRLYQAALAVLVLCAVYMYSSHRGLSGSGKQHSTAVFPALSYLEASVNSNTLLSICTSNLNKPTYDGTTRN